MNTDEIAKKTAKIERKKNELAVLNKKLASKPIAKLLELLEHRDTLRAEIELLEGKKLTA